MSFPADEEARRQLPCDVAVIVGGYMSVVYEYP